MKPTKTFFYQNQILEMRLFCRDGGRSKYSGPGIVWSPFCFCVGYGQNGAMFPLPSQFRQSCVYLGTVLEWAQIGSVEWFKSWLGHSYMVGMIWTPLVGIWLKSTCQNMVGKNPKRPLMFRRAGAHGWNINASSLRPAKLSTYYCNIDWIDDFLSDLATLPTHPVWTLFLFKIYMNPLPGVPGMSEI